MVAWLSLFLDLSLTMSLHLSVAESMLRARNLLIQNNYFAEFEAVPRRARI